MSEKPDSERLALADPVDAPPPPSDKLRAAIASMRPVGTHKPGRTVAMVALLSLAWCAAWVLNAPLRSDLAHLNPLWVGATLLAWLLGFAGPMVLALLPPRGQVSPDGARAGVVTAVTLGLLLVVAFALSPEAEGHTRIPPWSDQHAHIPPCLIRGLAIGLGIMAMMILALRRVLTSGAWRLGAAAGAAGGALGGLVLEIVCALGGAVHVGFGHGSAVLLLAALGALIVPRFMR